MNYYNEIDKKVAAWLRELIKRDLITPGEVDERSIEDVVPSDLKGFTQCHFFAGIGGWSYALRLAGWPDDQPIWTGSCPCQPFSSAGKGAGFDDERHLWPVWFHLIKQCQPAAIFGEQVAAKNADPWIDLVHADLESVGYAFGCLAFPSAGIGSPQIRDRNYWVGVGQADSDNARLERWRLSAERTAELIAGAGGLACGMGNSASIRQHGRGQRNGSSESSDGPTATIRGGLWQQAAQRGAANGFWRDAQWIGCLDGRSRPVEPGTFPLAHGVSERVVRLRGYGNAINPYAAKAFIEATQEALNDLDALQTAVAA